MFGSQVCVKQSGDRRSKLDRHDYNGIFLGYTASDHNIRGNGYSVLLAVCSAICPASFGCILPICMGAEHFGK